MVFGISVMDFAVRDPSRKKISGVVIPWPYESIPGFGVAPSARIISSFVMGSQKLIRTYSKHPGATRKTGSKMGKKMGEIPVNSALEAIKPRKNQEKPGEAEGLSPVAWKSPVTISSSLELRQSSPRFPPRPNP
jgi:hypothetical protein